MNKHEQAMNTRIAELVAAEMTEYYDGAYLDSACARDQLMRFAERIVRECIDIAYREGDNVAYLALHFGVEE